MDSIDIMQSQNFEFLRGKWPELADLAGFAEHYARLDPQSALTKLRNFAERSVVIVYTQLGLPRAPVAKFMEQLNNDAFEAVTPKVVVDKLHALRIHGNKAAHGEPVSEQSALWLLKETFDIGRWLFVTYGNGDIKTVSDYQPPKPTTSEKADYKRERKALLEQYAKQEAQMQATLEALELERQKAAQFERSVEELEKLQQQAAQKGHKAAHDLHFDEATTRKYLIDLQLAEVGWQRKFSE